MMLSLQIKEALLNLVTSKLRSFLALLGILIGTASVVAMISGGRLATQETLNQIKILGTNLLAISLYSEQQSTEDNNNNTNSLDTPIYPTVNQINSLSLAINTIENVGPYTETYLSINYEGNEIEGSIIGVTENLKDIIRLSLLQGRFISDLDNYQLMCVIGNGLYADIKTVDLSPIIGKQIRIGNQFCTVVGILNNWPQNNFIYTDLNHALLIPIQASFSLNKYVDINNIVLRLDKNADFSSLESSIKTYLSTHSRNIHFYFKSPEQLLETANKQSETLTIFLGFIGGISLLVGGIGVMNIMLVSVIERRREIGIRMAIGASRKNVQSLFLIEAVVLSLFGGILGVILGILVSYGIALYRHWQFTLYFMPPTLGFSVSVLVGIFFGFYPAYKASKLNPIEALKSE